MGVRFRTRSLATVALVFLVVLSAGCTGLLGEGDGEATPVEQTAETPTQEQPETSTATPPPTPAQTATPTATPTPEPVDAENPFGEREIGVAIYNPRSEQDYRPVVRRALDYWEENSSEYAGYPINFTLTNLSDPHRIRIQFDDAPVPCGSEYNDRSIGCSPVNLRSAAETTEVTIAENQTDRYTYQITVHELGHALGLQHDDQPQEYMQAVLPSGLSGDTVRVYITGDDNSKVARQRSEIDIALSYFEDHPQLDDSDEPTFVTVPNRAQADFIIELRDGGCDFENGGVCPGDSEYRGQDKLIVDRLETEYVAWYTASVLAGVYFDEGDVPEELSDDTPPSERDHWDG